MRRPAWLQQVAARGKKHTCPIPGTVLEQTWTCHGGPCHLLGTPAAFLLPAPAALHQFPAGSGAEEGYGTDRQAGQLHHHLSPAAGTELPVWAATDLIPVPLSPSTSRGSRTPSQQEVRSRGLFPAPVSSTLSPRAWLLRAWAGTWLWAHLVPGLPLFPQVCPCFAQATVPGHHCSKTHRFVMLGKLVGHLTLCCTCKDKGTRHEAAEALYHLHTFIVQQLSKQSRVGLGPLRHGQLVATLLGERKPDPTCLQSEKPFPVTPTRNSPGPSLPICSLDLSWCPLSLPVPFLPNALRLHLQLCTLSLSAPVLLPCREVALAARQRAAAAPGGLAGGGLAGEAVLAAFANQLCHQNLQRE